MYKIIFAFCLITSFMFPSRSFSQAEKRSNIQLGVYYFGGWTGKTNHITRSLTDEFPERKPQWGWYAPTPEIISKEIDIASEAGISFFSFCWYYVNSDSSSYKRHPLNSALPLFLKAPNKAKLKFNLLIANHNGTEIGPKDWNFVIDEWMELFRNNNYLSVDNKPLITIFSIKHLVAQFGSPEEVKKALQAARLKAMKKGFNGINFAICLNDDAKEIEYAKMSGFDIFTGYNYHYAAFNKQQVIPIDSLLKSSVKIWNKLAELNVPYIPAITLNWDPRPWANFGKKINDSPRYNGYSERSVYESVVAVKHWIKTHQTFTPIEKIAMIYAWNEYGEGAWLTPDKNNKKLIYLKKALINEIY